MKQICCSFKKASVLLLVCILTALPAASCGQSAESDLKSIKIGVCAYKMNDTFIATILAEMEQAAKEYEQEHGIRIDLDFSDARESQRTQNEQIRKYISLEYDVLCVNIVDRTIAAAVIDDAVAAGTPLIFFNREPVEQDLLRGKQVYYVGSDAKMTAVLQGLLVLDELQHDPDLLDRNENGVLEYFLLEGEMGHQDTVIRSQWAVQTLTDRGVALEKLHNGVANWERSQAAALVEQWITVGAEDVELIICNNDDMALGAADALEKLGITDVAVVGVDATPQGVEAVRDGRLLGTVDCNPAAQGRIIFTLSCGLAIQGTVPGELQVEQERYVRVPLRSITQRLLENTQR